MLRSQQVPETFRCPFPASCEDLRPGTSCGPTKRTPGVVPQLSTTQRREKYVLATPIYMSSGAVNNKRPAVTLKSAAGSPKLIRILSRGVPSFRKEGKGKAAKGAKSAAPRGHTPERFHADSVRPLTDGAAAAPVVPSPVLLPPIGRKWGRVI